MAEIQFTRRSSITALVGATALLGTGAWGSSRKSPPFNLDDRPLGIQLYTLGNEFASDADGMFAALSRIGFRRFECDLLKMSKPEFRAAASRHGLSCTSVHLNPMSLTNDAGFPAIVESTHASGVRYAGLPIFPFQLDLLKGNRDPMEVAISRIAASRSVDDWKRTADLLNRRGADFQKAGIRLFYHNHNVEFRPLEGTTPFALLVEGTDPALVSFELDVGWVAAAGLDPVAVIKTYPSRFRLMHVKDIKAETQANFEMKQVPAEIGSGRLDWPRVIAAARRAGITEYFVEQEPPFSRSRIEAAEISAKYLRGLKG
ncbi:sugar phosphate isomerase/epimerase family protein [Novosphingobium sp. Chol11]|uniref:sugar phosphate isomerase/epimerase family protein n=1 Tax=Novosphingobium sp. Chol11 TaxID=1385763 RepID=UPI000BE3B192|nr:sugar phosphate isomerase/epimerase [Novosphingobium sp. Chol11]